jgi:sugar phosphate isomerase/epimerase
MTLGRNDLVLCSGTIPRDITFAERVDAAVAGGFSAISLWGRDYQRARDDGLSDADIRALLADHGLRVGELDPAWWWLPGAADIHIPPEVDAQDVFRFGETEMFAIAGAVGARSITAVDVFGGDWTVDDAADAFATLCDRAAEHGLIAHIEFLPWSRIPDLATAWDIVRLAGRTNSGVVVDTWHWFRGTNDLGVLAGLPSNAVAGVQLNDAPAAHEANLIEASLHDRLLPGDGDFDLGGVLAAIAATGADAPIGVEVFNDDLHALGPIEAAKRAGDAVRAALALAEAAR